MNKKNMDNINKTLYIPLYGKAFVSKKEMILTDKTAENIWQNVAFPLKRKAKSKWLAYYMGMRAAVFDEWVKSKAQALNDCTILHLGCGLDSRVKRVGLQAVWYDVDVEAVIEERKEYFYESDSYHMLAANLKNTEFLQSIPTSKNAIIVMEGVAMYLTNEEIKQLLSAICKRFESVYVLLDCYTPLGVKMSKIKNPIHAVGATEVYGIANPLDVIEKPLAFSEEKQMTPDYLIDCLQGMEKRIFKRLFAGNFSKKLYKMYEYKSK